MIGGPYGAPATGDSPSRRKVFVCRPERRRVGRSRARTKILSTLATRAYRRPVTDSDVRRPARFLPGGPRGRQLRRRHPARARAHSRRAELPVPRRARAARGRADGSRLSPQRSRSGVAAVVLSLEQHSGRRAARGGGAGHAERSGRAGAAGAADAARSALERAGRQLRRPAGSSSASSPASCPTPSCIREFDENLRDAMEQETQAVRRQPDPRRTAASSSC